MNGLVEAARSYAGVPWRHQGRSRLGLDCAGLIVLAARDCGIELKDVFGYGRHPWKDGLENALRANFTSVPKEQMQPGHVLLFRITRLPQHLAIATDKGMIHSHSGSPGVVEHGMDRFWADRLIGVYAL